MDNRTIGYAMVGIALLVGYITFSFNMALSEIVNGSCSHGPSCPMWGTIDFQTNTGLAIMFFIFMFGLYLILRKDSAENKIEVSAPALNNIKLQPEEKELIARIRSAEGSIYQSELVKTTGFSKVKITRLLDKLEGKGIIERRRRGMTNIVLLKSSMRN